jgi:hypothetical protein
MRDVSERRVATRHDMVVEAAAAAPGALKSDIGKTLEAGLEDTDKLIVETVDPTRVLGRYSLYDADPTTPPARLVVVYDGLSHSGGELYKSVDVMLPGPNE